MNIILTLQDIALIFYTGLTLCTIGLLGLYMIVNSKRRYAISYVKDMLAYYKDRDAELVYILQKVLDELILIKK